MSNSVTPSEPFNACGSTGSGLTSWELRKHYRMLFRGVYVSRETPITVHLLGQAALLAVEAGSHLSHHTAAQLWGAVVPDDPSVHVSSRRSRAQRPGIAAHRVKAGQHVVTRRGLRLTSPGQTFLDLAHLLNLVDLVVLGDSLVKANRLSPADLVTLAADHRGPHSKLARRAAGLVRSGVDSAMETRLRLLMIFGGLPEPEVDHRVHAADGSLLYRFDLCYLPWRLLVEYDGRHHAADDQWHSDIARDEQFDSWGLRKIVVVAGDIYRTPANTLTRIRHAMREQGMPVPPLSNEWRRHFPSRSDDLAEPA
ncbi:hypothetical protein BA895_04540 [Humibacillus sp. DSM 29435]|nr:hypothetical protein BA895_04540 [Humibacillus sp. DSM 29435]